MRKFISLVCGLLFGAGLAISGMNDTHVVRGFLDIFGVWNPALLFVMLGAVTLTLIGFRLILKRSTPVCAEKFYVPDNKTVDKQLLIGAVIFGTGWGIYGYCPGPAISSLVYLQPETFSFVAAMAAGMFIQHLMSSSR